MLAASFLDRLLLLYSIPVSADNILTVDARLTALLVVRPSLQPYLEATLDDLEVALSTTNAVASGRTGNIKRLEDIEFFDSSPTVAQQATTTKDRLIKFANLLGISDLVEQYNTVGVYRVQRG